MLGVLLLAGVQAGEARVGADLGPSTPSKEFISPPASHFKPQGPKGPGRVWSLRLQFVLSTQPFCATLTSAGWAVAGTVANTDPSLPERWMGGW